MQISRADAIFDIEGDLERESLRILFERELRAPRRSPVQSSNSVATNALATVFEQLDRIPSTRPRQLMMSPRFRAQRQTLPARLQKGLRYLLQDVESGGDLRPYLSTQVDHLKVADGLLNQWGIHHFHLGAPERHPKNERYVARTGELLFAVLIDKTFRTIGVLEHNQTFGGVAVLNEFLRGWPELVEPYRMECIRGSRAGNPSPNEVVRVREAGANPLVMLSDGFVYSGPRVINTAGHTQDAADMARAVMHSAWCLAYAVQRSIDQVKAHVARITQSNSQRLVLSLNVDRHLQPSIFEHRGRFSMVEQGRLYYHSRGQQWLLEP